MEIVQWIGIGVLGVLVLLTGLFLRRWWIARAGGTIELYLRLSTMVIGRGWAPGLARFAGDDLRWYRLFSFGLRPRRILSRRGLAVDCRRPPEGSERFSLPDDWLVLRCTNHHAPVEIAMSRTTVAGFLSWLEAAPPGAVSLYSFPPGKE